MSSAEKSVAELSPSAACRWPQPRLALALALALIGIGLGQWLLLFGSSRPLALVVWLSGLGIFLWLESASRSYHAQEPAPSVPSLAAKPFLQGLATGWLLIVPLVVAVLSGVFVAIAQHARSPLADHWVVVLPWSLSLAAVVAAAEPLGWARAAAGAARVRVRHMRIVEWAPAAAIFLIAALARFVSLGSFPVAEGDGLSLALVGREVLRGSVRDPFSTGWFDNPTLYAYTQAGSMRVFGETLLGARFISALVGTLAVVATFFWSRHLFGRRVSLAAAALLAVLPMHVYFSRVALNLVEDTLSLVLVLWLVDRAFVHRRPLDAVRAGLAIGLAQYFYFSARFLVPLALALTVAMTIWWFVQLRSWRDTLRAVVGPAVWMWFVALLTCLPLAVHFLDQPEDFNSRGRQVSATGPWLQQQSVATGDSEVVILTRQLGTTALLPFATSPGGQYHPDPPLVGWPMAPAVAAGLAMVTATAWRRRQVGVALAWWGSLLAVGLTIGFHAQRWILATPLIALCAALGLDALRRIVVTHLRVPARAASAGMVCVVIALMAWNVHFVFRDSNELIVWSDGNSLTAAALADELSGAPADTTVYTAFAPRMFFDSHSVVPFLADQVVGIDLLEPLSDAGDVPRLTDTTIFAFLPERVEELQVVRSVYPNGSLEEFNARDGTVMLVLYTVVV